MSYRFLRSPRWLGFALFVVLLGAVCVQLGIWQWQKLDERAERNDLVRQNLSAAPVPLDSVVAPGSDVDRSQEWTQVEASGRFDPEGEVVVQFVNRDGVPGVEVVTPLLLEDGSALLVDRGFLETRRTSQRPEGIPEPPDGTVTVSGWLRPDSNAGPQATQVQDGQVRAVSSDQLAEDLPYQLRSGYVDMQQQDPAPPDDSATLAAEPYPDLGSGPHFFYALQWWFFALLAIVGYGWFARVEARDGRPASAAQLDREREVTPAR